MTWLAQVGHVARKDVRQFWWLILVYVALVAVVTANARSLVPVSSAIVAVDAFVLVAFGMATAATLVQSDSPSRSNAFWATRPLDPSAVLAAKLVVIVLGVIGIGVLGEIVGLEALSLRAGFVGTLVMRSIGLYAIWLVAAISIAALTPDFRTFALSLLVTVFAFFVLAQMLFVEKNGVLHLSAFVPAVGVLVAMGALVYRYRRRDTTTLVWGMAGLGVFTAFLFLLATPEGGAGRRTPPTEAVPVRLAGTANSVDRGRLVLHLRAVGGDTLHSYTFLCDTLIAHLADGSAVSLAPRFGATYLQKGVLPAIGQVHWRPESRDENVGAVVIALDDERSALGYDVKSIDIAGRANEYAPDFTASLPLRTGQSAMHNGVRVRIGEIVYPPDTLSINLSRASVEPQRLSLSESFAQDPFAFGNQLPDFVLVNRVRGEALLLRSRANSTSTGWVVLPGAPLQQSTTRLAPERVPFARDTVLPGREWYSDAQLYLFQWKPRGTYRVHASIAVR